jgi:hypothetical protein
MTHFSIAVDCKRVQSQATAPSAVMVRILLRRRTSALHTMAVQLILQKTKRLRMLMS